MRHDVIPERYNLGLPGVKRHDAGYADLEWDPKALCWVTPREPVPQDPVRVPDPAPRPRVLGHKSWDVLAGRVRLYQLRASDRIVAEAEATRLLGPRGWRVVPTPVEPISPAPSRSGLTAAEVRSRLGLPARRADHVASC